MTLAGSFSQCNVSTACEWHHNLLYHLGGSHDLPIAVGNHPEAVEGAMGVKMGAGFYPKVRAFSLTFSPRSSFLFVGGVGSHTLRAFSPFCYTSTIGVTCRALITGSNRWAIKH